MQNADKSAPAVTSPGLTGQSQRSAALLAAFLLSITALAWAGNYVLGRAIAGQVPPAGLAVARWLVAVLGLLPFAWPHWERDWPLMARQPGLMLVLGATGGASFGTLQYAGMQYTTAMNASLMGATSPVLIALAGAAMFADRLSARLWLGLVLSLAGVLVIAARGEAQNLIGLKLNIGDVIVLTALATWAIYSALLRKRPAIHWTSFALATFVIGLVGNLPLAVAEHLAGRPMAYSALSLAAALYTGIVSSLIGFAAWNRGVELIGSQRAGLYLNLVPVFTVALSHVLIGERLQAFHGIACVLILAGLALAMTTTPQRARRD